MKTLAVILAALTLAACDSGYTDNSADYTLPYELKHCSVYKLSAENVGRTLHVVHCPRRDN